MQCTCAGTCAATRAHSEGSCLLFPRYIMATSALFNLFFLLCAAHASPPSLYWASAPRASTGTVLWAGSFSPRPTVSVCEDGPACASPSLLSPLLAHNLSIAVPYPPQCFNSPGGPCAFSLCSAPGDCTLVADPHAPDVWWGMAFPPLPGASFYPGAAGNTTGVPVHAAGGRGASLLRVFGRNLAFSGGSCVPSDGARSSAGGAWLLLTPGSAPLPPLHASCYEATYNLSDSPEFAAAPAATPFPKATIVTAFGSAPMQLQTLPPSPAAHFTLLRVDDPQFSGSVSAALLAAAGLEGDKVVLLGARSYACAELAVPERTALIGGGADVSGLVFDLAGSQAPVRTPAINGLGSHWALKGFSLTLSSARAYTPAVLVGKGFTNFTAEGLRISLQQNNVSNAFSIAGGGWSVTGCDIVQGGVCMWPPTSDTTDFPDSTTFRLQGATDGYFARNSLVWSCSAFDMDVSSRIVFE